MRTGRIGQLGYLGRIQKHRRGATAILSWHHKNKLNFWSLSLLSQGSKISKVTLCVQILKCHTLGKGRHRVGIELPGELKKETHRCKQFMYQFPICRSVPTSPDVLIETHCRKMQTHVCNSGVSFTGCYFAMAHLSQPEMYKQVCMRQNLSDHSGFLLQTFGETDQIAFLRFSHLV